MQSSMMLIDLRRCKQPHGALAEHTSAWDLPDVFWTGVVGRLQALRAMYGESRRVTEVCMLLSGPQPLQKPQVRTTLMPRPDMVCRAKIHSD